MEWLHILVGAASTLVIGAIWYHPKVFGNAWMNSLGYTEEDLAKGNMALIYGVGFLISAIIAFRLNGYATHTEEGMSQFVHGAYHGAYSAGAVAVAVLTLNSIFERRSVSNILINAGYWLISLGVMGGILYSFHPA